MSLKAARWRLALIWFVGCALFMALLVAQSIGGAYGDAAQKAWSWALPNFLPTLALMVSVFAAEALVAPGPTAKVARGFLWLTMGLSAGYILLLFVSLLAQPLFAGPGVTAAQRLALMEMSNLWLGPVQGLTVTALGVLFYSAKKDGAAEG